MDNFTFTARPLWDRQFVTDGFSSERQLLPVNVWLRQLDRRHKLELERQVLLDRREREIGRAAERFKWMMGALAAAGILAATGLWIYGVRARENQSQKLRAQIARDLHDEVEQSRRGDSLERSARGGDRRYSSQGELANIRQVAKETSDALRDMVWVLHNSQHSAADLALEMERIAERMMKGRNVEVKLEPPAAPMPVPLEARRNILLAFREILSNVIQHSGGRNVSVSMTVHNGRIGFRVADDGQGFDPAADSAGWGLRNLRKRAGSLNGKVSVHSGSGTGSVIEFEVPLTWKGSKVS